MKHLSLAGEWLYNAGWGRGTVMLPAVLDGCLAGNPGEPLREKITFSRTVSLPRRYAKRRAFFYLEQAGACSLWINGQEAGTCIRRYLPWEVEVTGYLRPGDNEFVLELDGSQNPSGCSGCGKIELLLLSQQDLDRVQVREGVASVLPHGLTCGNVTVEIGNKSFYCSFVQAGWVNVPFETRRLKRWSPGSPRLYRMNCILTTSDWKEIKQELWIGLRRLSVENNAFCMDGTPFYLIGREPDRPLPSPSSAGTEWWAARFQLEKAHGVNFLFCSGWCPPEDAFLAADQAGFLLAVQPPGAEQYGGDEALRQTEAAELARLYGNHPSFAMASGYAAASLEERFLPVTPVAAQNDLLVQTAAGSFRLAVIPEAESFPLWKAPVEAALLRRDCAGILLRAGAFPDEFPVAKGFSGLFARKSGKPTLRQWREFCSDMVLLLEERRREFPCGGVFSSKLLVRNHRKPYDRCVLRWKAGQASGMLSCPLPLGLHELGQITFPLPEAEGAVEISVSIEEAGCQNQWRLCISSQPEP